MSDYRIYKYPLRIVDFQSIEIEGLQRILSVGLDPSGELCIWVLIDKKAHGNKTYARVAIVGTGNPIQSDLFVEDDDGPINRFLGSVTMGIFVWHVFVSP